MFDNLETRGGKTALVSEEGKTYSYEELSVLSSTCLVGIRQGSLCFLICENIPEAIIFYVGLIRNQITTMLIPGDLSESKIESMILTYSPDYVISNIQSKPSDSNFQAIGYFNKYAVYENKGPTSSPVSSHVALCLTTSGSTGSPKFVKLSLDNLQSNTYSIIKALDIEETQRTITTMPMSYSYGLSVINTSIDAGGTLVVNSRPVTSKEFWNLVIRENVNTLSGVPYIYEQLSRVSVDFLCRTRIMKLTQAGGKLKREIRQHFSKICKETGIRFYVMYGQTEATARIAVLPPDDFAEFDNAIGFVVPGGKLTIVDEQENQIRSPGIIGELCYEGPNVFQGYATNRSDLNLPNSSPIILKTGDLGFFDSDARFFISGRIKRIAKILGIRVNLEEVESFLATAGFEAYCIEYFGKLFVVTVTREVSQEVKAELFAYLGMNSQLISFLQIDSIPRMDSGKVDYPSILEFLGGQ